MLTVAAKLSEISYYSIMEIYRESNEQHGKKRYGKLPPDRQLLEAEQDFYAFLQEFFKKKGSFYCIWSEKGENVAALRFERYKDGYLLEGLETVPGHRGNGYAKQLMKEACALLINTELKPVYSHIAKDNPASMHIHLSCGFRIISHQAQLIDGKQAMDHCTLRRCPHQ